VSISHELANEAQTLAAAKAAKQQLAAETAKEKRAARKLDTAMSSVGLSRVSAADRGIDSDDSDDSGLSEDDDFSGPSLLLPEPEAGLTKDHSEDEETMTKLLENISPSTADSMSPRDSRRLSSSGCGDDQHMGPIQANNSPQVDDDGEAPPVPTRRRDQSESDDDDVLGLGSLRLTSGRPLHRAGAIAAARKSAAPPHQTAAAAADASSAREARLQRKAVEHREAARQSARGGKLGGSRRIGKGSRGVASTANPRTQSDAESELRTSSSCCSSPQKSPFPPPIDPDSAPDSDSSDTDSSPRGQFATQPQTLTPDMPPSEESMTSSADEHDGGDNGGESSDDGDVYDDDDGSAQRIRALAVGSQVLVFTRNAWQQAVVAKNNSTTKRHMGMIKVHYHGAKSKSDEWIPHEDWSRFRGV
jgi:hypothetical protein